MAQKKVGPSGKGRAALGMTNSTGCSSVWASTYPFNPYPFPWANHLFQDAPSLAIGIFEGHMRKMADNFAVVRKAELELNDAYDSAVHDDFFVADKQITNFAAVMLAELHKSFNVGFRKIIA